MAEGEFRLRVCYPKAGRLRWLSHLEVTRSLERSIRRSGLSYALTQGFSPHMKLAFGPALPVGFGSEREYLDVWLTRYTEAGEALRALQDSAPADLAAIDARYVPASEPSLGAAATIAPYVVVADMKGGDAAELISALGDVMASGEFSMQHKGKHKVFDLRTSIPKDPVVSESDGQATISLTVRLGPHGALRPDVLVRDTASRHGIPVVVSTVTRLDTLIEREEGVWVRPV